MKLKNKSKITIKRYSIILVAFGIIGIVTLLISKAATPTITIDPETGTVAGNASVVSNVADISGTGAVRFGAGSTARRFFSPEASWNKTVAQLGSSTVLNGSTNLAGESFGQRLWNYGGGPQFRIDGTQQKTGGGFTVDFKLWSVPVYDVKTATPGLTARVYQTGDLIQNGFSDPTGRLMNGRPIPWNYDWIPKDWLYTPPDIFSPVRAPGDDTIAIVNYDTGEVIEIWRVAENRINCSLNLNNAFNSYGISFDSGNASHLCIGGMNLYGGPNDTPGYDLWSAKEGKTRSLRGMGINKLALITRADEVKAGKIEHALSLTIAGVMFGPDMTTPETNYTEAGAGVSKGFYLPPATRLENKNPSSLGYGGVGNPPVTDAERSKTIPSGMRFALNITNGDIDAWLLSRQTTARSKNDSSWDLDKPKSKTARVFAVALRDYGAVSAETGGNGIGIETDGLEGPQAATWKTLGIEKDPTAYCCTTGDDNFNRFNYPNRDLLDGLITKDRLYVVNPPAL